MTDFLEEASQLFPYARAMRRDFHEHPELGFQEIRTAGIIEHELTGLGLKVTRGIAKTGVVAILDGKLPGKTILLRFDMDALPINETTHVKYSSKNPGVMHACGHDGHIAIGLTVAKILTKHCDEIPGTVKFVFQPAEEGLGGAEKMISEGVLENPTPDYCLAMHLWNEKPLGWVSVVPGPLMAGADLFKVIIEGKGGHGALPHQTHDPILAAAQVVSAIQGIVARNISPLQSAVISFTMIRAGDAYNVIPQTAELCGTIRTFEKETRDLVLTRFKEVVERVSLAMGCEATIETWGLTPSVINNPIISQVVETILGQTGITQIDTQSRTMVSEDMALFLNQVPGCFLMVGSANEENGLNFAHHHPMFNFDENALVLGAGLMSASAIGLLDQQPSV